MSTSLHQKEQHKQKHTLYKLLSKASIVKSCIRVNGSYCKFNDGLYLQSEANNIMCEYRTGIVMCKCKLCDASTWKGTACGTTKNSYEDKKLADRHKWLCHDAKLKPILGINAIDENTIEE